MDHVLENVRTTTRRSEPGPPRRSRSSALHGANCPYASSTTTSPGARSSTWVTTSGGSARPGGVVGRAQEGDDRVGPSRADRRRRRGRVGGPGPAIRSRPPGGRQRRDVAVQGVGRLEDGRRTPGPAVGEQQALEDLVGPVGAEQLGGIAAVELGQGAAQGGRFSVGVAVEVDAPQLVASIRQPLRRRRQRRLVGVEPHLDVDLRGVVAGKSDEVVAQWNSSSHHRLPSGDGGVGVVAHAPRDGLARGARTRRGRRDPRPRRW